MTYDDLTAPHVASKCIDAFKYTWHGVHDDCWNALQDKLVTRQIPHTPRRDVNGLAQSLTHVIHKAQKSMQDGLCIATTLHNNSHTTRKPIGIESDWSTCITTGISGCMHASHDTGKQPYYKQQTLPCRLLA